ncbi:MAG: Wzz/FepE/Etk N-terminal domain-containing protein [Gemmatimonadales bacterium]
MTQLSTGPGPAHHGDDEISVLWILAVLLRERRTILVVTGVGMALALVVALLRAPTYTSTFSFVPQVTQDPGRAGLASLAGQFGLSLGAMTGPAQSPQFYADLLRTREILAPVAADSFSLSDAPSLWMRLPEFFGVSGSTEAVVLDNTMRTLREKVIASNVATRTTGVVTVNVRTRSARVSLGIADRLLAGLNQFNLNTRRSQAAAERRFVEGRLEEARASLRAAEDALQRFLQANRQIANSPQLTFQRDRLDRDVTLQQQIVTGLVQQYEDARIREVRDTPVITVIERPAIAARADPRRRVVMLAAALLVSLFLAISWVLVRDAISRRRDEGDDAAITLLASEWKRLRRARQ